MRNISFALTTEQVRNRTKTVTRRLGWAFLKPGIMLRPVKKSQGLRKGERVESVGGPIRTRIVRREPLRRMLDDDDYGRAECIKEGFPDMAPSEFVAMFCASHRYPAVYEGSRRVQGARWCTPDDVVTRIEFEYVAEGR